MATELGKFIHARLADMKKTQTWLAFSSSFLHRFPKGHSGKFPYEPLLHIPRIRVAKRGKTKRLIHILAV